MKQPGYVRIKKALARNIRRRRLELKLTQEEAAHQMGLATRHLQKLEIGEVNVTLRTLAGVSRALGTDISTLFRR